MITHKSIYDFLENIEPTTFVGVDALTMTSKTPLAHLGIDAALMELKPKLEVEIIKAFRFQGAVGFSQGPIRYAAKRDASGHILWAVLMATGPISTDLVKWSAFSTKVTRIDFRIDVVLRERVKDLAERLYRVAGEQGKVITSPFGSTFYPSEKRESTYFGRIYDKSPEYGEDFGKVWRWEVEIKRDAANSVADTFMNCHARNEFIEDTTFGIFAEKWGVPTPKPGLKPVVNYVAAHIISTEQKLDWIRRNVARTVQELKRIGYTDQIEALFALPEKLTEPALNDTLTGEC